MYSLNKAHLDRAKAFLCWDKFPDLSIQLIELGEAVGYFVPPAKLGTLFLFYSKTDANKNNALFLLFHEAVHYLQYQAGSFVSAFDSQENLVERERNAWTLGRQLFLEYLEKESLPLDLEDGYDLFSQQSIQTYLK